TPNTTYTLSLHDALPISEPEPDERGLHHACLPIHRAQLAPQAHHRYRRLREFCRSPCSPAGEAVGRRVSCHLRLEIQAPWERSRSEEHTSELQSPDHIVC